MIVLGLSFFFFQAEDGIRDLTVTGVQTCALPISCSTYSCQLFSISSLKSCTSVPARRPGCGLSGWYTTRWEMRAGARRRAFCFGSCTMNGLTGGSGPVMRCPGARAPPVAAGAGDAGDAGAAGGAGGAGAAGAARAKGAPRAAGTTGAPTRGAAGGPAGSDVAERVGAGGGRNTG